MFRRRARPSIIARIRQFVWPDMGVRRLWSYLLHRIRRLPGTPYSIAAGFACGAAASFTPLVGLHFLLSIGLAWLVRANWVAAMIGTVIGNPWTFPFIWYCTFRVGQWIIGLDGARSAPVEFSLQTALEHPVDVFVPLLVGGVPLGILAWVIFYWPLKWLVASYQEHRAKVRAAAQQRRPRGGLPQQDATR